MLGVFPGSDNHVRAAKVKFGEKEYTRSISRLILLKYDESKRARMDIRALKIITRIF